MTFDWSVVWQHRDALLAGTGTTILLTVLTMAIAVPCGMVVAALRLYAWTPVRAAATAYVALFRNLPGLASTWVSLFKDTSLVSVIAVSELAYVSMQIRSQTFRVLEMLTAMAAIYWMLGYPQAKLADWIQRRFAVTE